jgi:F0F1-type ATP synthase membrane subunit c/vacuolar-type H+-ATPase subunit K
MGMGIRGGVAIGAGLRVASGNVAFGVGTGVAIGAGIGGAFLARRDEDG